MNGDGPAGWAIAIQAGMAVALVLVGTWGRQAAETAPPNHMSEEERAHRAAVMRRGSIACIVIGAILAVSVLWSLTAT